MWLDRDSWNLFVFTMQHLPNGHFCAINLIYYYRKIVLFFFFPPDFFTRECKASSGQTGFLCDDRSTCIAASALCDGKVDCGNGEDESRRYCG